MPRLPAPARPSRARFRLVGVAPLGALATFALAACGGDGGGGTGNRTPARLEVLSGLPTRALVGATVAPVPAVRVLDASGRGVGGIIVTFSVAQGSVTPAVDTSDADGRVGVTSWTLGPALGNQTLTATAAGLSTPINLTVEAIAGTLTVTAGDAQAGTVGAAVGTLPTVRVTDGTNPVAGVPVTFVVGANSGTITGATQTTGTDGTARLGGWTLGTTAGAQTVTVTAAGVTRTVTVNAAAAAASAIAPVAGAAGQSAAAGSAVAVAPGVRLTDQFGNPVAGTAVTFAVASGGGTITGGPTVTTNAQGVAQLGGWTLGGTAGAQRVTATAGTLTTNIDATATAAAPSRIVIEAGNQQSAAAGATLPVAPLVRVFDRFDNPVAGVVVTFSTAAGSGCVRTTAAATCASPVTVTSGTDGRATVASWTLGNTSGAQTLTAAAGQIAQIFSATATGGVTVGPATQLTYQSPFWVNTGPSQMTGGLVLRDANGNVVTGDPVTITATVVSGPGTLIGGTQASVNPATGIATFDLRFSVAGTYRVQFRPVNRPDITAPLDLGPLIVP